MPPKRHLSFHELRMIKKHKRGGKKKPEHIIPVMIEIPKGSRNKYEYDLKQGVLKFNRMLFSAVHYPSDYGFIPDALVLVWEPTFPGCLIEAKPIGLFKMWDEKGPDEKILCVPIGDPMWNHIETLDDVNPHLLKEIEHFFKIYKDLENKNTGVEGWRGLEAALKIIQEAKERYARSVKNRSEERV